ncbi:PP2C family protein-serine/threonine phosphatase [Streptomyces alkaliphilus]|uniref:PP2C family protein-serine/threonine phosphatase n=1 Tax=Streptomyces alkaliphilus TaxID=1472722 RepID=UPI0034D36221
MSEDDEGVQGMLSGLITASHMMPFKAIPEEVGRHAAAAGMTEVLIYLCDLQQHVLRRMTGAGHDASRGLDDEARELNIDGTVAGRAFRDGRIVPHSPEPREGEWNRWWIPLLDGTERLGVLGVRIRGSGPRVRRRLELLASTVALLVVSKQNSSDAHARLVRAGEMNVAAEMQWHLMPARTYADYQVVLGAAVEPAYEVGGDAFDYALSDDVLHLSIFDSMGHDTSAGVAANLAVAACRRFRRRNDDLGEISVAVEKALIAEYGRERYVTGILARLDLRTGLLQWVNRGHPTPLLLRGDRGVTHMRCPPAHPMGTDLGLKITLCHEQLRPGDRLVLYTDGITEARRTGGREFGLEGFTDFLLRHHAEGLPVPETLRRLVHHVLEHHEGRLTDDATVMVAQWLGDDPRNLSRAEDAVGLPRP